MTTHTDELIAHINAHAPSPLDEIKQIYDEFVQTTHRFMKGEKYYMNESDILDEKVYTYVDDMRVVDNEATNERIPSGMHKILVDQKVSYLTGEPMSFGSRIENGETMVEQVEDIIGEHFEDVIVELLTNTSNKGVEWLRVYVNEDGEFAYMIAKAEQTIELRDQRTRKLMGVIYFYAVAKNQVKLELWTDKDVTYYEMLDGKVYLDATQPMNPAPHFTNAEGTEGKSWGRVPFIKFANNPQEVSDLTFYKRALDGMEKLVSKTQNTAIDIQELILILRGYEGEELSEFVNNLRRYKAIKTDSEGGVDALRAEIPVQAYETQYEILRKTVITAAQGVDPSPDVIGDAPSGVALQHLYGLLDMKASMLERKTTLALREFLYFVAKYCELAPGYTPFNYRDVTITFNKMLLTNETEIIDNVVKTASIGSLETALENHPWVRDVAREMERIQAARDRDLEDDYTPRNNDKDE